MASYRVSSPYSVRPNAASSARPPNEQDRRNAHMEYLLNHFEEIQEMMKELGGWGVRQAEARAQEERIFVSQPGSRRSISVSRRLGDRKSGRVWVEHEEYIPSKIVNLTMS